jgi:uncharacterized protein with HEPN domain
VAARALLPRLTDIIEASSGFMPCCVMCLAERGVEIISEASRHRTDELKARRPEIPWQKVAGIGNVLRPDYETIAAPVIWKLAQADLPALE